MDLIYHSCVQKIKRTLKYPVSTYDGLEAIGSEHAPTLWGSNEGLGCAVPNELPSKVRLAAREEAKDEGDRPRINQDDQGK